MQIYPNRGKRKEDCRWVTGFFYEDTPLYAFAEDGERIPRECYILEPDFADWGMPRAMVLYKVIPESIGVYTGMNAKMPDGNTVPLYTGMRVNLTDIHGYRKRVGIKGPLNGAFYYGGDGQQEELLCFAKNILIIGDAE